MTGVPTGSGSWQRGGVDVDDARELVELLAKLERPRRGASSQAPPVQLLAATKPSSAQPVHTKTPPSPARKVEQAKGTDSGAKAAPNGHFKEAWEGDHYYWNWSEKVHGATFHRIKIATLKDAKIYVLEKFGGQVIENGRWLAQGQEWLHLQVVGFNKYVLPAAEGQDLAPRDLDALVEAYFQRGGYDPIKKTFDEREAEMRRIGSLEPGPDDPNYASYQRKRRSEEYEKYIKYYEKQGYSRAFAQAAIFMMPASVNPSGFNLEMLRGHLAENRPLPFEDLVHHGIHWRANLVTQERHAWPRKMQSRVAA